MEGGLGRLGDGRRDDLAVEVDGDDGVELLLGQGVPLPWTPAAVRIMLTTHWPLFSWALADLTAVPVTWDGPSTYRAGPLAAGSGEAARCRPWCRSSGVVDG